jgi:hypothetical protein
MAVMPTGGKEPAKTTKKKTVKKSAVEQKIETSIEEQIDKALLKYPTDKKILRFFGDTMLLIGSVFTNIGLRYGGVYEYEFESEK